MNIKHNLKKIFGFAAVAGLLFLAAPAERAQAMSLSGPGIAAAVQSDASAGATQVQYRRDHRGYRPHHRHARPHHGYHRRPHFVPRHHHHGRRHHRR